VVLTAPDTKAAHRSAASTAASIHLHYEGSVVETPLEKFTGLPGVEGVAVLAPEQGLVEWFPHQEQDLVVLAGLSESVVGAGWRIAVLVESQRMGEAHRAFRGSPVALQAWWQEGERVRFGGPEVP
jgi:hypothetical protein